MRAAVCEKLATGKQRVSPQRPGHGSRCDPQNATVTKFEHALLPDSHTR